MNQAMRLGSLLCVFALLLGVAGCGESVVKATGKVVKGGKAFQLSPKGMFAITFYRDADKEGKEPFPADSKPDGTFEVLGKSRTGIPTGKYRISLQAFDPYPGEDLLKNQFTGAASTTLSTTVNGKDEIILELGK
ncbi:MAG: hypothetical protein L0215_15780 [Gemmataceae bacterium]|nr:hypothetical protein [Gemmataceae bacterium]